MRLIWTPRAADDFEALLRYIERDNPDAAARVATRIWNDIKLLVKRPGMGHTGEVSGTFEWPMSPLPYIVVYRVTTEAVRIIRIRHGAQRWPPR